ncbi:MAG: porin family protein [Candidatus Krumholzibacteriia bacterium]
MRRSNWVGPLAVVALVLGAGAAEALPLVPSFGVKAGVNLSRVDMDVQGLTGRENRTGFVGGPWVRLPLPGLALQVEALYARKGFKGAELAGAADAEAKYTYLDVPVLVRFAFPSPVVAPYVFAGGQLGILLDAEGRGLPEAGGSGWVDIGDWTRDTAFALVVGAGVDLASLHVDLRYSFGLTDLSDLPGVETKDRTFSLMAGVRLF